MYEEPKYQIHYADDWVALYVDGRLVVCGDSYIVEERAFELLGVLILHDSAWMRGGDGRVGVAATLGEVNAYRVSRDAELGRAAELKERAADLVRQATEIEKTHGRT